MSLLDRLPGGAALPLVAVALALVATYRLGVVHGSAIEPVIGAANIAASTDGPDPAALEHERDSAIATVSTLRDRLADVERVAAIDAAELELYRRIGKDAERSGLGIDAIDYRRTNDGAELAITLVQARGRDRVAGHVGITLLGEGGETDRRALMVLDGDDALPFDLRFFETVVVPLGEAAENVQQILIEVTPASSKQAAFIEIRDWDTIVPEDLAE